MLVQMADQTFLNLCYCFFYVAVLTGLGPEAFVHLDSETRTDL